MEGERALKDEMECCCGECEDGRPERVVGVG